MAENYDKLVTVVNQSSDEDEENNEEETNMLHKRTRGVMR
jgi:hypothetical protein